MPSLLLLIIAVNFVLISFINAASVGLTTLKDQCWHEYPLSRHILLSSKDGKGELVLTFNHARLQTNANTKSDYEPWTHRPICTEVLPSIGSKLCVYTNSSFSKGRGISIFTTPRLAEEFANLPAFQDVTALTSEDVNVDSDVWRTQGLPGKGVGMLAKKQLGFKDRITAYTPALVAFLEEGDELSTMEREKFYRIAVYQLPNTTREAYLQLTYIYGQPSVRVQDIVKANTFQLQIGGHNHMAVFPETSRINHACSPNAQYYLNPTLLTHFVHATRQIPSGEEITISYTSPLEPTEMRQQHLQEGFHFTCTCSRCSNKDKTDGTLNDIQNIQNSLNDWSESSTGSSKLAEKMIQLYRKEGLEGFLDIPYGFAALAYNAAGNVKKAKYYAQRAQEAILMKDGPWTPNMAIWEDVLKDPKKHWSYNRRMK